MRHKIKIAWYEMKGRCNHPHKVLCWEWRDFDTFYKWSLENGCQEGLQIDADILCKKLGIPYKLYSPDTCLWVTPQENRLTGSCLPFTAGGRGYTREEVLEAIETFGVAPTPKQLQELLDVNIDTVRGYINRWELRHLVKIVCYTAT